MTRAPADLAGQRRRRAEAMRPRERAIYLVGQDRAAVGPFGIDAAAVAEQRMPGRAECAHRLAETEAIRAACDAVAGPDTLPPDAGLRPGRAEGHALRSSDTRCALAVGVAIALFLVAVMLALHYIAAASVAPAPAPTPEQVCERSAATGGCRKLTT